jgi:Rieske Fe-S protein
MENLSRREFLVTVGKTAVVTTMVMPVAGFEANASSGKAPLPISPITLDLTKAEYAPLAQTGGSIKILNPGDKSRPIIVTRLSETNAAAYSSRCSHMGCEVNVPSNGEIKCPCHGSLFDVTGKVKKGPAKRDLTQYSATLDGTTITVKEMTAQ